MTKTPTKDQHQNQNTPPQKRQKIYRHWPKQDPPSQKKYHFSIRACVCTRIYSPQLIYIS